MRSMWRCLAVVGVLAALAAPPAFAQGTGGQQQFHRGPAPILGAGIPAAVVLVGAYLLIRRQTRNRDN